MIRSILVVLLSLAAAGAGAAEPASGAEEKKPVGKTVEHDPGREGLGKTLGKEDKPQESARPARDRKLLITTMLSSLKDEDENIRAKAAEDIARLKPPAVEAVPALISALGDKSPTVRYRAAETLERIGTPKARKAVLKFRRKLGREKAW